MAVLNDSLFLRFMGKSIARNTEDKTRDFIIVRYSYDVECIIDGKGIKILFVELRTSTYGDVNDGCRGADSSSYGVNVGANR